MGIQLTDLLIKECITIDTTLTLTLTLTDTVMVMLCVNRPSRAQRLDSCKQTFKGTAFGQFVCPH